MYVGSTVRFFSPTDRSVYSARLTASGFIFPSLQTLIYFHILCLFFPPDSLTSFPFIHASIFAFFFCGRGRTRTMHTPLLSKHYSNDSNHESAYYYRELHSLQSLAQRKREREEEELDEQEAAHSLLDPPTSVRARIRLLRMGCCGKCTVEIDR